MPKALTKWTRTDVESGADLGAGPRPATTVHLVPFDPGLPRRLPNTDFDSQCDCACFAVQSEALPLLHSPVSFYLELTPTCNNRCPTCGNVFTVGGPGRRQVRSALSPLDDQGWGQILTKVRAHAHRLKLTGGEPTLHRQFGSIVGQVAKLDIPFTILTNGRWPAPERTLALLQGISSFEGFLVSVHGPTARSHQAFTETPGSFAETLANTRRAVQAGLDVSLSCIITQHNWNQVAEMLKLARQLGAGSVVFNRYLGPDTPGISASREELRSAVQTITALRRAGEPVKLGNCLPACFAPTDQPGCLAGLAFVTIDPWGRVRPCNHARLLCGSLLEQPLEEIWRSPGFEQWRNYSPAPCQGCAEAAICRGGCQAQALACGLDADPLISAGSQPSGRRPPQTWTFYDQARPVACFSRRPEEFGWLLSAGNRLSGVSHEAQDVLDALDGHTPLRKIAAQHGPAGLALVASLYQQGMVELRI